MNSAARPSLAQGASNLNTIVSNLRRNLTNLGINSRIINTKISELKSSASLNKDAYAKNIVRKAKAAKVAKAAKAAKAAKVRKVTKTLKKTTQKVNNPKTLRGRIYQIFNSVRKTNDIDNKRIFNFLFSYYKDAHDTFLSRTFDGKSDDFIKNALIKQYNIMKKNDKSRNSGYVRRVKIVFNGTNLKDFVMMMYLDMYHDKTFTGTLTDFVKSGIPGELLGETNSQKLIGDTILKQELIKEGIFISETDKPFESKTDKYENKFKNALGTIFRLKEPYLFNQSVNLSNYAKDKRKPIYISIDAESKKNPFSLLIAQSRFKNNGSVTRKFVKSIISISNRVDPGNLMPSGGGAQEYNRLFNFETNRSTRSTQLYDFCDYAINFHKTKILLRSRLEEQTEPFYLSLNDKEYPLSASAKKGQANTGTALKISKFLGDFLQVLVTATSDNTFLATQDGMCSAMTIFMFTNVLNKTPRLFIEYAFPQGNKFAVYGAENLLKTGQNHNLTNILTGRSSGGTTISSNNSNNNNAQSKPSNITNNKKRISAKRPRNNNKNVGQPNAKRVNTTRNRLIQNLKKKSLPNFVVNGLMQSYDNKRKTANQIIREANNFGKTFAMGKTAQIKSTLRPRKT